MIKEDSLNDKYRFLTELFDAVDREIGAFREASGLVCPAGCGACCESPNIESTVLELMPLAVHLSQEGEAEHWLQRAVEAGSSGRCIFHRSCDTRAGDGRCRFYAYRPLVCRLFGFSAKKDKFGRPVFIACRVIEETQRDLLCLTEKKIREGMAVPIMTYYARQVACSDYHLGARQRPINEAVRMALEKIIFLMGYARAGEKEGEGRRTDG